MYKIRKFVNHIYKTTKTQWMHNNTYIHIHKYKYTIDNFDPLEFKVLIHNKKPFHYIKVTNYVVKYKKNNFYNYSGIRHNNIVIHNDNIKIVIDDRIHINRYTVLSYD